MDPLAPPPQVEKRAIGHRRRVLPWTAVVVWLVGCGFAFWRFELSLERPFETLRTTQFDVMARQSAAEDWYRNDFLKQSPAAGPAAATVVHLYRGGCACNRFTDPHLARIVARFQALNVRFVAADATGDGMSTMPAPSGLHRIRLTTGSPLNWLDATPAALVFDAAGRLVYYGPYSDGARCGEGVGLVERVLDHILNGQAPPAQGQFAAGCFCGNRRA